jgi:CRISPR-associated protein Cmr1
MNFAEKILNRKESVFDVEIVTPAFALGADREHAELREQTINGLMRFWWRAFFGSDDLENMQKRESEIFGSTEKKSDLSILIKDKNLKINKNNLPKGSEIFNEGKSGFIHPYLSYGVSNKEYIEPGSKFKLHLSYSGKNEEEILTSLFILTSFGGIGARSRNGYGSINIEDLLTFKPDFNKINKNLKRFTSFSNESKVYSFSNKNKYYEAHYEAGLAYARSKISLEPKHNDEKRRYIAKPINVKKRTPDRNITNKRHSKQYFIKVTKRKDNTLQSFILHLPHSFYQGNENLEYKKTHTLMNQELKKNGAREQSIEEALNDK